MKKGDVAMRRFTVADLYEKKYTGEMTMRMQFEQKKRQAVKESRRGSGR